MRELEVRRRCALQRRHTTAGRRGRRGVDDLGKPEPLEDPDRGRARRDARRERCVRRRDAAVARQPRVAPRVLYVRAKQLGAGERIRLGGRYIYI